MTTNAFEAFLLAALCTAVPFVIFFLVIKLKKNALIAKYKRMSNEELFQEYQRIKEDITLWSNSYSDDRLYSVTASIMSDQQKSRLAKEKNKLVVLMKEMNARDLDADSEELLRAEAGTITGNSDASVVGRAIAGGIIAGPTGAIIGAASAADKNAKNRANK